MAREVEYKEVERVVKQQEEIETFHCDKCGREVWKDNSDGDDLNYLEVLLNPDECVSYGHGRDYCPECAGFIWDAICQLIGADPESLSKDSLAGRY